jgi:hypothetical protein
MKRTHLLFCLVILAWCAQVLAAPSVSPKVTEHPATWRPYDLIVDLNNLPHRYSCDDLWYKFHDVLRAMGAAPGVKILAYRCEPGLPDVSARSPRVHLRFSMPELLTPVESHWAELQGDELQAAPTTVHLAPGHPASLGSGDCELLRQMKDGLLASLSQKVVVFDLACAAPQSTRWPFSVTVQALIPSRANSSVVAQAGNVSPRT